MRIHVARNRQPLGHFAPEEISVGLRSGRFLLTDLAWREPMESWKPLSEFTDLPAWEPQTTPPPLAEEEGAIVPSPVVLPTSAGGEPAWERRAELGLSTALIETVKAILSTPVLAFQQMKTEGGLKGPLAFYAILGIATAWVNLIYSAAIATINPEMALGEYAKNLTTGQIQGLYVGMFCIMPIFVLVGPFIWAGLFHVFLLMMGGAKKSFEATFRVICYGAGAVAVFQFIPVCGSYIYLIWILVAIVVGLKEVHSTDYTRAVLAVILPGFLFCGTIFLLLVGLIAVAAGLSGGLK